MSNALTVIDSEIIDTRTGEVESLELATDRPLSHPGYHGIAASSFSERAIEILRQPTDPARVSIRPDGIVFVSQNEYRRALLNAFGPGAWGVQPIEIRLNPDDNTVTYRGALFVHGRFVSEAYGEHKYQPTNRNSSYTTSVESAKSDCLTRCCKDLGLFAELWDKEFVEKWKAENAVQVWCSDKDGNKKPFWRKRTDPPIDMFPWKENGSGSASREAGGGREDHGDFDRQWEDQPPQSATERPVASNGNGGSSVRHITDKQVYRLKAIAKKAGWYEVDILKLIEGKGFTTLTEITMGAAYDEICSTIESTPKV